jgi:hypothetical protein
MVECNEFFILFFCQFCDVAKVANDPMGRFSQIWLTSLNMKVMFAY